MRIMIVFNSAKLQNQPTKNKEYFSVRWKQALLFPYTIFILILHFPICINQSIAEITNSTEIQETIESMKMEAIYDEIRNFIDLNISFKVIPDSLQQNVYLNIWLIKDGEDYCSENDISERSKKQLARSVIFDNIIAGCTYEVFLYYPKNQHVNIRNYTVPECVENKCVCDYMPQSIEPVVTCEQLSMNVLRIIWNISKEHTMTNISTFHIRVNQMGTPNSVANLHRNIATECLLSCYEDVTIPGMTAGAHYVIEAWYSNALKCTSEKRYLPYQAQSMKESQIVFQVMISMMFVLMVLASIWLLWKKRERCGCLPANIFVTRSNRSALDSSNMLKNLPVPMDYNPLYKEKEIEEGQDLGTVDKYEVSYKLLQLERLIGGGEFGQVFKASSRAIPNVPSKMPIAVKTLKTNACNDELEEFLREITMLKQIGNHPNIVTLLGCCTLRQPYCMVMEYIPCGDLLRYLHALRTYYERSVSLPFSYDYYSSQSPNKKVKHTISDNSLNSPPSILLNRLPSITKMEYTELTNLEAIECVLDPRDLQNFAVQIARGMRHLESKQIVHRDLAARNVLIDEKKILKISDFGLSRRGIYVNSKLSKVPLRWLSIEAIRDYLYTSKSDVWAYGILLWEIGTLGGFPYPTVSNEKILEYLLNGQRLNKPENCTAELYSLMERCWLLTPQDRPTFTDILIELETISSKQHVYVDFGQLNPTYMFPPKDQLCPHTNDSNEVTLSGKPNVK